MTTLAAAESQFLVFFFAQNILGFPWNQKNDFSIFIFCFIVDFKSL